VTTPAPDPQAALLLVHAHPDDETLTTGITMARHVRDGHRVHVLTCTLGEEGEVIPGELQHLDAQHDDALGPHRREELRGALAALGVTHEVLGEDPAAGRLSVYRDSGMAGVDLPPRPDTFVRADLDVAAAMVADVLRRVRPAAVVTYDERGGYLHPDHVQTHRVTCTAVASLPAEERPALYAVLTPASWARADREWLRANPPAEGWTLPDPEGEYPPSVVDDAVVTHEVVEPDLVEAQAAALRHHVTQVTVGTDGRTFALSNDAARLSGREGFALLDPETGRPAVPAPPGAATDRRHTDLLEATP
jgi:N-acetyl-1-D-myo-inositol-2-amino-2-deoxy-alpha-D-glucopyranoside deacetylase